MLRRELIRVAAAAAAGLTAGIALWRWVPSPLFALVLIPLYAVSLAYAGRSLCSLLAGLLRACFQCQLAGLLSHPLPGMALSLLLLILGLPVLLAAGYLMGLARCAAALWTAFRAGRSP
ncbi:MAG: hypothetical protein MR648_00460 [Clostridiales bacterium]|nr:hypothetical protein [Clostridiales bacterium]MDY4180069.1 hypothetical protein [Pseudoflavonifractor sp.]